MPLAAAAAKAKAWMAKRHPQAPQSITILLTEYQRLVNAADVLAKLQKTGIYVNEGGQFVQITLD